MLTKLKGRLTPSLVVAAIAGTFVVGGGSAVAAKAMIDGHDIAKNSMPATKLTEKARERLTGAQGPVGPQGKPGVDGKDGKDGKDGSAILGGAGAPASLDGTVGDYYFDTAGKTLYGPKSGSAGWGMGTSLKGDPGDPGESGAGSSVTFYEKTSELDSEGGRNDAYCDPGDTAVGGGGTVMNYSNLDHPVPGAIGSSMRVSGGNSEGWRIAAVTSSHKSYATVTCADTATQQQ